MVLPDSSNISKLSPIINNDGLLRTGGRIDGCPISFDARHPIILSHKHPISRAIVVHIHETFYHCSTERTVLETTRRYWITKVRAFARSFVNRCPVCRRRRVLPVSPLMAALPANRLLPFQPPFTITGVAYFRPVTVVLHRRSHKRYGCIFTCMNTRAVHLEMSHTLDTDSFLLAFWRFAARRGFPAAVYSDNGTNLSAGEKEIRNLLLKLNQTSIADGLSQRKIQWSFSPPSAPYFGRVWERMMQSAKRALTRILDGQSIKDEILNSALVEVESLLNGRPLTHLNLEHNILEPLMPNHFLSGRAAPSIPAEIVIGWTDDPQ